MCYFKFYIADCVGCTNICNNKRCKIVGGIDYSGKGTVITGTIASGKTATVSGNYVNIPIYKGKYVVGLFNGWGTKKWSGWSVSNNKNNADFSIYNGSNKATEYSVESRKEYQYKRLEKRDNYDTKYYTKYKGTKWYNSWQTITSSSWNGYPGAKSGYKIVSRYTKKEKHGIYNVTVFDNKWRTSAPINLPWENKWTAYNTRTTYRYKSRTLKWDAKATTTTEQVPLNYSLYDQSGKPIKLGVVWIYNEDISEDNSSYGTSTQVKRYMLNSAGIKYLLQGKEDALDELIKDNGTSWWEIAIGAGVSLGTMNANPYVGAAVTYAQILYSVMGQVVADKMQNKYDSLKEMLALAENYNLNIVFEYYQTITYTSLASSNYIYMDQFVSKRNYISMKYQNNENPKNAFLGHDAYGSVSYITDTKSLISDIDIYVKIKSLPSIM